MSDWASNVERGSLVHLIAKRLPENVNWKGVDPQLRKVLVKYRVIPVEGNVLEDFDKARESFDDSVEAELQASLFLEVDSDTIQELLKNKDLTDDDLRKAVAVVEGIVGVDPMVQLATGVVGGAGGAGGSGGGASPADSEGGGGGGIWGTMIFSEFANAENLRQWRMRRGMYLKDATGEALLGIGVADGDLDSPEFQRQIRKSKTHRFAMSGIRAQFPSEEGRYVIPGVSAEQYDAPAYVHDAAAGLRGLGEFYNGMRATTTKEARSLMSNCPTSTQMEAMLYSMREPLVGYEVVDPATKERRYGVVEVGVSEAMAYMEGWDVDQRVKRRDVQVVKENGEIVLTQTLYRSPKIRGGEPFALSELNDQERDQAKIDEDLQVVFKPGMDPGGLRRNRPGERPQTMDDIMRGETGAGPWKNDIARKLTGLGLDNSRLEGFADLYTTDYVGYNYDGDKEILKLGVDIGKLREGKQHLLQPLDRNHYAVQQKGAEFAGSGQDQDLVRVGEGEYLFSRAAFTMKIHYATAEQWVTVMQMSPTRDPKMVRAVDGDFWQYVFSSEAREEKYTKGPVWFRGLSNTFYKPVIDWKASEMVPEEIAFNGNPRKVLARSQSWLSPDDAPVIPPLIVSDQAKNIVRKVMWVESDWRYNLTYRWTQANKILAASMHGGVGEEELNEVVRTVLADDIIDEAGNMPAAAPQRFLASPNDAIVTAQNLNTMALDVLAREFTADKTRPYLKALGYEGIDDVPDYCIEGRFFLMELLRIKKPDHLLPGNVELLHKNIVHYPELALLQYSGLQKIVPTLNNALRPTIRNLLGERGDRATMKADQVGEAVGLALFELTMIGQRKQGEALAFLDEVNKAVAEYNQTVGTMSSEEYVENFQDVALFLDMLSDKTIYGVVFDYVENTGKGGPGTKRKALEIDITSPKAARAVRNLRKARFKVIFPEASDLVGDTDFKKLKDQDLIPDLDYDLLLEKENFGNEEWREVAPHLSALKKNEDLQTNIAMLENLRQLESAGVVETESGENVLVLIAQTETLIDSAISEVRNKYDKYNLEAQEVMQFVVADYLKQAGFKVPNPYVSWSIQMQYLLEAGKGVVCTEDGRVDWEATLKEQEVLGLFGHRGREAYFLYFLMEAAADREDLDEEQVEEVLRARKIPPERFRQVREQSRKYQDEYKKTVEAMIEEKAGVDPNAWRHGAVESEEFHAEAVNRVRQKFFH